MLSKSLILILILGSLGSQALHANNESGWNKTVLQANGQTVYFNAWGGSENINQYISWTANIVKKRFNISLKHVKVADISTSIKRIQTEKKAARHTSGSIDLLWVNGENFRTLKINQLLYGPWVETIPNWIYVDTKKPVRQDFSESTDGLEAPWGSAQLTFLANRKYLATPPQSAKELLLLAQKKPGRITYPKPPSFHGTTFLKQLLIELTNNKFALHKPVNTYTFANITQPLWDYLNKLHPVAWHKGTLFPHNTAKMHTLLADSELILSMTFNPNEGANLIAKGELPSSIYSFGFKQGTIGNIHFLAIPYNANAKAAAQVVTNFLLSPEAQAYKANLKTWGDPTIINPDSLNSKQRLLFKTEYQGALDSPVPTLSEPHSSWVDALEKEWLKRYGG